MYTFSYRLFVWLFIGSVMISSCSKDYGNLNNPTVENYLNNASRDQLNNLVSGTESAMRNDLGLYLDDVGVVGREMYRFSGADPRYTTDLLGANDATLNNTGFYIVNPWSSKYRVIKNCNLLIEATNVSANVSAAEKKGYLGFAKTIKAYQFLLLLNLTGENGIRLDVADAAKPGPIVGYAAALDSIASILDLGQTDFSGAEISFPLSTGFGEYSSAGGLIKFNRALAARVDVYREKWADALTALDQSFYDAAGSLSAGIYHVFGTGSGDQLNSAFFPQNQAGEVRVAHPSFASSIENGDDRISKATLRSTPVSYTGLTSDRDVWVYRSSTDAVPVIRNEELILIHAEANIRLNDLAAGTTSLNIIRQAHGLADYSGAQTEEALITEMLQQRRYSLFYEGHRWVDMRRYGKLADLPVDRSGDDIWSSFPLPSTEK